MAVLPASATAQQAGLYDPSFGSGGIYIRDLGQGGADGFAKIAVAADGSMLVAGTGFDSASSKDVPFVAKFAQMGLPPANFGVDGVARGFYLGGTTKAMFVDSSGRIVVAGDGAANEYFFERFGPSGLVDGSFGTGLGYFTVPRSADDRARAITRGDGDRVVLGATRGSGANQTIWLQKFNADGSAAGLKSNGGITYDPNPTQPESLTALMPAADDGFIDVGTADFDGSAQIYVRQRTDDGGTVDSFNSGNPARAIVPGGSSAVDAAYGPGGSIVVSGNYSVGGGSGQVLVRFLATGQLDPSFGSNGAIEIPDLGDETNRGVAVQSDGKVIVVGSANGGQTFSVVRLNADGSPDTTFGLAGRAAFALGAAGSSPSAATVQPAGRIVVVGSSSAQATPSASDSMMIGLTGLATAEPTPFSRISAPSKSKLRRSKLRKLSGSAGPVDLVARVEIAIRRIDAKQLKKKRCVWIASSSTRVRKVKDRSKKCEKQVWLRATGRAPWSFKLKKKLPVGKYVVYSRATLIDGTTETSFSKAAGNRRSVTLKK